MGLRKALLGLAWAGIAFGQANYDLLLKGGHVIDGKNRISAIRDVAIKDGKVAAVAANIPAAQAFKVVDVSGMIVSPGLVDIHVHVYAGAPDGSAYGGGPNSIPPDGFTLRNGVTTVADAGSSGWRTFPDFKARIIDTSVTRVVAFLNIVGNGMRGGAFEQNMKDMEAKPTAEMALKHKGVVVGVKSAHFAGPEWHPYAQAAEAAKTADIPVMIDFGSNVANGRTIAELFSKYLKPGDIYTHCYSGNRGEQDPTTKGPSQAMLDGRKKGIIFDVGHGGSSFRWACAIPLMKAGFIPDSISTDIHRTSMNAAMKDQLNVMDKFLAMGMTLDEVILRSTWHPAKEIKREDLGNLSVGSPADIAVLRVEKGKFGFIDPSMGRVDGTQRLHCEITLRDGKVVWELNGITRTPWDKLAPGTRGGDPRWDGFSRGGGARKNGKKAATKQ